MKHNTEFEDFMSWKFGKSWKDLNWSLSTKKQLKAMVDISDINLDAEMSKLPVNLQWMYFTFESYNSYLKRHESNSKKKDLDDAPSLLANLRSMYSYLLSLFRTKKVK